MEMEVMVSIHSPDFSFDSSTSTPYITAPSSPQRFGTFYFTAPTSPTQTPSSSSSSSLSLPCHDELLNDLSTSSDAIISRASLSSMPFQWDRQKQQPVNDNYNISNVCSEDDDDDDEDFEFEFSGQLDKVVSSASADELFDGGKIRPLEATSSRGIEPVFSQRPRRSTGDRKAREVFLNHQKKESSDEITIRGELWEIYDREDCNSNDNNHDIKHQGTEHGIGTPRERGREKKTGSRSSPTKKNNHSRKGSNSLPPLRVSDILLEEEDDDEEAQSTENLCSSNAETDQKPSNSSFSSLLSSISLSKGYRKWSFKDFLLFRSASEGRGSNKDPLRKYAALSRKGDDAKNSSSFRSVESIGSMSRRRGGNVSAHELHYTANRAAAEEMRKRTYLPYKHGLLGCLGYNNFNPGVPEMTRGFGSM